MILLPFDRLPSELRCDEVKSYYDILDKKRFSPHITLIRKAPGEMPGIAPVPVSMTVNTIFLMRSDRGRNGMIYTELGRMEAE